VVELIEGAGRGWQLDLGRGIPVDVGVVELGEERDGRQQEHRRGKRGRAQHQLAARRGCAHRSDHDQHGARDLEQVRDSEDRGDSEISSECRQPPTVDDDARQEGEKAHHAQPVTLRNGCLGVAVAPPRHDADGSQEQCQRQPRRLHGHGRPVGDVRKGLSREPRLVVAGSDQTGAERGEAPVERCARQPPFTPGHPAPGSIGRRTAFARRIQRCHAARSMRAVGSIDKGCSAGVRTGR
jgi:hypothetical protein